MRRALLFVQVTLRALEELEGRGGESGVFANATTRDLLVLDVLAMHE